MDSFAVVLILGAITFLILFKWAAEGILNPMKLCPECRNRVPKKATKCSKCASLLTV